MMSPLRLDYQVRRSTIRPGRYALIAALALAAYTGMRYWDVSREVATRQLAIANAGVAPRPLAQGPVDVQEYGFARDTIRHLSMPWGRLFRALEASNIERIALLAIEPSAENRTVALSGEAKEYLDLLTYVARLSEQEALQRVHLVRHEVRRDGGRRGVAFVISTSWSDER